MLIQLSLAFACISENVRFLYSHALLTQLYQVQESIFINNVGTPLQGREVLFQFDAYPT